MNFRVTNQFAKFREQGLFVDCRITSNNGISCNCHKLVLAKHSTWFRDYFESHKGETGCMRIHAPIDPHDKLAEAIDFLYTGYLNFDIDTIIDFLKIADFYGIELLKTVTNDQLQAVQTASTNKIKTVLYLAENLIKIDLVTKSLELAPEIASELHKIINKQASDVQLADIFRSVNAELLSEILLQPIFQDTSPAEKATLIDSFVGDREETEQGKRFLSMVVNDWSDDDSYQLLVENQCDWVTPDVSRRHYSKILDIRRRNIRCFGKECREADPECGRLFVMSWMDTILHTVHSKRSPSLNAVDFVRTQTCGSGGDVVGLGLVACDSSKPVARQFAAKHALQNNNSAYFLSVSKDADNPPFLKIDLGPMTKFSLHAIQINCSGVSNQGTKRLSPAPLAFYGVTQDGTQVEIITNVKYNSLETTGNGAERVLACKSSARFRSVIVTQAASNMGFDALRIYNVEIKGRFHAK